MQRIRSLDGLRGVAAAVVLLHHALLVLPAVAAARDGDHYRRPLDLLVFSPLHIAWAGTEAVLVFFVLSGFVLALPADAPGFDWRAYYPSRLLRLYLPVLGSVAFAVLLAVLVPLAFGPTESPWLVDHVGALTPTDVVRDATLLAGTSWLDTPLWSLRWEVLFSLLLPAYLLAVRCATRLRAGPLVPLLAVTLTGIGAATGVKWLTYLPVFAAGVWLLGVLRRLQAVPVRAGWALLVAAALLLTCRWTVGGWLAGPLLDDLTAIEVLGAVLLVVLAARWGPATTALTTGPARRLGGISFSLYLTHEPVLVALAGVLPPALAWLVPFVGIPLALAIGWGFHRIVERPSHRLARAVGARVSGRRRARRGPTSVRPS